VKSSFQIEEKGFFILFIILNDFFILFLCK